MLTREGVVTRLGEAFRTEARHVPVGRQTIKVAIC